MSQRPIEIDPGVLAYVLRHGGETHARCDFGLPPGAQIVGVSWAGLGHPIVLTVDHEDLPERSVYAPLTIRFRDLSDEPEAQAVAEGARVGDRVQDRISGFYGIVTGRAEYLYGCVQVLISPAEIKDGAPVNGTWLDEGRVHVIKAGEFQRPDSAAVRAGGPVSVTPPTRQERGR